MNCRTLRPEKLTAWLGELLRSERRLIAPQQDGDSAQFRPLSAVDDICWDYVNTRHPVKEWLFPPSEHILRYRYAGNQIELEQPELAFDPQVIFGVRPCDAAGLAILDRVFNADGYEDEFYTRRRSATTVVGVSCSEPAESCFCTAVGLSPTSSEGCDLLLTALDDKGYLVEAVTARGEQLLWEYGHYFGAGECSSKEALTRSVEARMNRRSELAPGIVYSESMFEHPVWAELSRKCLSCGICAYVCPTCHCFDIVDTADAWGGVRCRNWDSCGFSLFTLHASGHNPRPGQDGRYRQRVLHKFSYFPQAWGQVMCVGCGRCVIDCPVNLDIYAVAREILRQAVEPAP
jgi:ferredoxin